MSWKNAIRVNAEYTRAINIERDRGENVGEYILTDNALRLLRETVDNLERDKAPRAWNLIGPYGSGKSAFALYLSRLLGGGGDAARREALRICRARDKKLTDRFLRLTKKGAFCPILICGAPESFARRLMSRLEESLALFFAGKTKPKIVAQIRKSAGAGFGAAIEAVRVANKAVVENGGGGLLFVVDELGKFLEHEVESPAANNVYLLQQLAEFSRMPGAGRVLFFGLLHRGFERYAQGLGRDARMEWAKAQGRFEEKIFVESAEQMLRLTRRVIARDFDNAQERQAREAMLPAATAVWESGIFPAESSAQNAIDLLVGCYPLHPLTAVLLSRLSEKIGQNERALFSYLGGRQEHGFFAAIDELQAIGECVTPDRLYDYFWFGGMPATADSRVRRAWAEAEIALLRLGDGAPELEKKTLKTVALFNLIGARGKFCASPELLTRSIAAPAAMRRALKSLAKKSLVVYRKYAGEYRVWQGSDFDLDEAAQTEAEKIGRFCAAEHLNNRKAASPILAHKHEIETGNQRRLTPLFIDAQNWQAIPRDAREPRLVVFLSRNAREENIFAKAKARFENDVLTHVADNGLLVDAMRERRALERVLQNRVEIAGDPVAQRELKDRLWRAERREKKLLREIVPPAPGLRLWWRGESFPVENRRDLQRAVSKVMDAVYDKAPRIVSELINRDFLSGAGNAARRKLLLAMHGGALLPDLGIEKYPPEKAMYLSVVKKSGMHRRESGDWRLRAPDPKNDPANFCPLWERIDGFLSATEKSPRSFLELDSILRAPPFGVKAGVLPIFYLSALMIDSGEIAVFEDGKYAPYFEAHHLERFLAKPGSFTVRRFRVDQFGARIIARYGEIIGAKRKPGDALAISKPVIRFLAELPPFAKKTETTSQKARDLRRAIESARSPLEMLLEGIPKAMGFTQADLGNRENLDRFLGETRAALRELRDAYVMLQGRFLRLLAQALNLATDAARDEVRKVLAGRASGLERYTVDKDGLVLFLRRAVDENGDCDKWLERMLMFLADKPADKWDDSDCNRAEFKLAEYMRRMSDLEGLRAFEGGHDREDFVLLRAISRENGECEGYARLAEKSRGAIKKRADKIAKDLAKDPHEMRLAILADLLQSELSEKRKKDRADKKHPRAADQRR